MESIKDDSKQYLIAGTASLLVFIVYASMQDTYSSKFLSRAVTDPMYLILPGLTVILFCKAAKLKWGSYIFSKTAPIFSNELLRCTNVQNFNHREFNSSSYKKEIEVQNTSGHYIGTKHETVTTEWTVRENAWLIELENRSQWPILNMKIYYNFYKSNNQAQEETAYSEEFNDLEPGQKVSLFLKSWNHTLVKIEGLKVHTHLKESNSVESSTTKIEKVLPSINFPLIRYVTTILSLISIWVAGNVMYEAYVVGVIIAVAMGGICWASGLKFSNMIRLESLFISLFFAPYIFMLILSVHIGSIWLQRLDFKDMKAYLNTRKIILHPATT